MNLDTDAFAHGDLHSPPEPGCSFNSALFQPAIPVLISRIGLIPFVLLSDRQPIRVGFLARGSDYWHSGSMIRSLRDFTVRAPRIRPAATGFHRESERSISTYRRMPDPQCRLTQAFQVSGTIRFVKELKPFRKLTVAVSFRKVFRARTRQHRVPNGHPVLKLTVTVSFTR